MLIISPLIVVVISLQQKRCACSKIHFMQPVASGRTTLRGTNLVTYAISGFSGEDENCCEPLTLEAGTDMSSRNVGKVLPLLAA
jgi:hypothetical protein